MTTQNFNVADLKEKPADNGAVGSGTGAAPNAATPAAAAPPPGGNGTEQPTAEQLAEEAKKNQQGSAAQPGTAAEPAKPGQPAAPSGTPLTPAEIKSLATKEILEQLGVDSLDALQEKLKPTVVLTDEEKAIQQQRYESALDNFAVTKGLMTREEIINLDNVLKADARTLALNEFTKDFKATKADATAVEVDQAFKLFYNEESADETMKALGQKKIEQVATGIRTQLTGKREAAKANYDATLASKEKVPAFALEMKAAIKANVPEEITLFTEGDNKVLFKVPPEDKTELEKFLADNELFNEFAKTGATQQLSDKFKDRIEGFIFLKNKEAMLKTVYDSGIAQGTKQGSSAGATASFKTSGDGTGGVPVQASDTDLSEADRAKLAKVFGGPNK